MNKGKGNRKEQNRRRSKRLRICREPLEWELELIDGNYSYYAVAYCKTHKAYLTQGLIDTHKCISRKCQSYQEGIE